MPLASTLPVSARCSGGGQNAGPDAPDPGFRSFPAPSRPRPPRPRNPSNSMASNRLRRKSPVADTVHVTDYQYRYMDPLTGRWPSRDPIGERGGKNLYGFVRNDGVTQMDLLGQRTVTIFIHYYDFKPDVINDDVKNEFARAFDECLTHCKKSCHTVVFKWVEEKGKYKDYKDIGKEGHFLGWWPKEWHFSLHSQRHLPREAIGLTGGNNIAIDDAHLRDQVVEADPGLGIAIAHELGYHGIGGNVDWTARGNQKPTEWDGKNTNTDPDHDFVDSAEPSGVPGSNFSKQACKDICDGLDID